MEGQLSIFDCFADLFKTEKWPEPEVGEWVEKHGAVICHIMLPGYIGRKVIMDKSTESHKWFQCGVLEQVLPDHYYHLQNGDYIEKPCDRVIINTGKKRRSSILLMPGIEIYETQKWEGRKRAL